jgi:hypothetical protein
MFLMKGVHALVQCKCGMLLGDLGVIYAKDHGNAINLVGKLE